MIILKQSPDYFLTSKNVVKTELKYKRRKSLSYYLKGIDLTGKRVVVLGKKIDDLSFVPANHSEIIITPQITLPAVVKFIVWVGGPLGFWGGIATLAILAYSIYSYMNQPRLPKFSSGGGDDTSPTYSWDGMRTMQDVGIPVPIIYGEHQVGGNIINGFLSTNGDKTYCNMLLALCEGIIESISNIKINDNPVKNYSGISTITKLGTNIQGVIANFNDLHDIQNMDVNLVKDVSYVYSTIRTDVEAFELYLTFPGGLYIIEGSTGGMLSWSVSYRVEYKLQFEEEEDYVDLGILTISNGNRSNFKRIFRKEGLDAGAYDIRITRTSNDGDMTHCGDMHLTAVDEIITDDIAYVNTALLGIKALATDQLSGARPNVTCVVKGRKVLMPQIMTNESSNAAEVDWDDYYYDSENGVYRLFSDDSECYWDGESYVEKWGANPIWCVRDLITNTRYGLGDYITLTETDSALALEMSQVCEQKVANGKGGWEKRYRLDIVIDAQKDPIELVIQLMSVCNGLVFWSQGQIKTKIDRQEDIVQIFGMGNIVKDSFQQSIKSFREVYNAIDVQFLNEEKGYAQDSILAIDEDALDAGEPLRSKQVRLYVKQYSYALRLARMALKISKYVNKRCSIKSGISAIVCQPGDVVGISHDIPQWGFSGRVTSGSTVSKIKLDRSVTLEEGKTYNIIIFFNDDTVEEREIDEDPGEYEEVKVTEVFSKDPSALTFANYSIGIVDIVVKPFRVISAVMDNRNEVSLDCLEYNENCYVDDGIIIPTDNYSQLSFEIPPVENLNLSERIVKQGDGTVENAIDIFFSRPNLVNQKTRVKEYVEARIYLSDNSGESWIYRGTTQKENYAIIGGIASNIEYTVVVVSVSKLGEEASIDTSPQQSITVVGKSAPPSDVSGFMLNQSRDRLIFSWGHISDLDLSGYEMRYGSTWNSAYVLVTNVKSNTFISLNIKQGLLQSFWIKAIDTSGNYSENATEAVISIENVPFTNIISEISEQPDWTGDKVNLVEVDDCLELDTGELTGTYTTPVFDADYVATFKVGIKAILSLNENLTLQSFPGLGLQDLPGMRLSGAEAGMATSFRIKTSEDNITWSDWSNYQPSDYTCKYFQIEMTMTREAAEQELVCSELNYYVDLPDIDEFGVDEVVDASAGKEVVFTKTFHEIPSVNIDIRSGVGVFHSFTTAPDTTGFIVKLFELDGTPAIGEFSYHSHGI